MIDGFQDAGEQIVLIDEFVAWYLHFAEKRELLGNTNHLLYICRKTE